MNGDKISKVAAHYRDATVPGESCHVCRFRIDNGEQDSTCQKVVGPVHRTDVCDLFKPEVKFIFRTDVKTDFFTEDGIVHPIRGSDGYDSSKLSSAKPASDKPAEKPAEKPAAPASAPKTVTGSAGATGQKMPDYDALKSMKTVPGPTGSNGGTWKQDADGQKYFMKPAQSETHAYNEVAAGAVYHAAGVNAPNTAVVHGDDGKPYVVSQKVEGLNQLSQSDWKNNAELQKATAKDFGVDALLSNWDVHGLEADNVLKDSEGNPVRVDAGGAMAFRGMGQPKPSFDVGEDWTEPQSMRTSEQGKLAYGKMTDAEAADSLEKVSQLSIGKIKQAWADAGVPKAMATKWGEVLRDRKLQVPAIVAKLRGDSEPKGPAGGHSTATVLGKGFFRTQVKTEQEPMKSLVRVEAMRVGGARLSGFDFRVEQPDSIA